MESDDAARDGARWRRLSWAWAGVFAMALVAVGVLGAAVALPQPLPAGLDLATVPSTVPVVESHYDGAHSVAGQPQLTPDRTLKVQTTGTVTASQCATGDALTSGEQVLAVDGVPLVGLATGVPLWRDLARGASGEDVRALQTELARLGYPVTVDGRYGAGTQSAVRKLLGAGPQSDGGLLLARVVWLPATEVTPRACEISVGDSVAPGGEVATLAGSIASLQLAQAPEGDGWVATYADAQAPIEAGGKVVDVAFLAKVQSGPEFAATRDSQTTATLEIGVRLATPIEVATVPPSAVYVSGEGAGCVSVGGRSIPVRIVGSSLGQSLVQFDSDPPAEVSVTYPRSLACR